MYHKEETDNSYMGTKSPIYDKTNKIRLQSQELVIAEDEDEERLSLVKLQNDRSPNNHKVDRESGLNS